MSVRRGRASSRATTTRAGVLGLAALLVPPRAARAELPNHPPSRGFEWSATLATGVGVRTLAGDGGGLGAASAFALGARVEAVALRARLEGFGLGAYADASSTGFDSSFFTGGLVAVAPTSEETSFALALGAGARLAGGGVRVPLEAQVFWGLRAALGVYSPTLGLAFTGRTTVDDAPAREVVGTLRLDALLLALPVVAAFAD